MRRGILWLATLALLASGVGQATAGVIVGPDFSSDITVVGANDTYWGIQFTALQNSTLTSFDYTHRTANFGNIFSGTILLNDITNTTTVYTTSYTPIPANGQSSLSVLSLTGVNASLTAGHNYQLIASSDLQYGANDEVFKYVSYSNPAFSNSDISVTQGVFDQNPGFQEHFAWGAFTNITTASATPEPATLTLAGIGMVSLLGYGYRRRRQVANTSVS